MENTVSNTVSKGKEERRKPVFDRRLFWDIDFDKLDYDRYANFIIERVFDRGDVEDIRQCRRYYGDKKISVALTNAKWLLKETVYLAMAILKNELTDYRCYKLAQLNPQHWSY
ncbi:MAG: hypothetical protein LBS08_01680 [Candidatus Symbiothrix sp.]|jgi:hypothetical protein|nr:hypothetical protein [Candidatus Symbiothrix sp.]